MSLLAGGLAGIQAVLTGGLGGRIPQTAHPDEFNTPITNPDDFAYDHMGDDGDPEYVGLDPTPQAMYNGRSVTIYLPQGFKLPPRTISRLEAWLRATKPLTCGIRLREVRGATMLELEDVSLSNEQSELG